MNYVDSKNRFRILVFFAIIMGLMMLLIIKLGFIQILNNSFYKQKALDLQTRTIVLKAERGMILDRNETKLAFNSSTYIVWGRPSEVKSEDRDKTATEVSALIGVDKSDVFEMLGSKKSIVRLKSSVDKLTSEIIMKKKIPGVWTEAVVKREYPYNNFASYVLGHMNSDVDKGIAGIEKYYDDELNGKDGKLFVSTDVNGRKLPFGEDDESSVVNGNNVVLTVDEVIQHFTEKAVDKTLAKYKAKRAVAIVMDPKTGEILAMVAKPEYNSNSPRDLSAYYKDIDLEKLSDKDKVRMLSEMWRNPNISDVYEPGSVFKVLTASAALDEHTVSLNSTFNDNGHIEISGVRINCWKYGGHGLQDLTKALDNSCNPAFVQIGQSMAKAVYYRHIKAFGVMDKTGIDLPAEADSIFLPENKIGPVEFATMSYGHGISATPIQVITAVSSIANNGILPKPHIVKRIEDPSGKVVKEFRPVQGKQVIAKDTAEKVKIMMESVVVKGSGKKAYIPGIRVGGKTGTSVKFVNGKYRDDLVLSSFAGIAPIEDPKIVVLVVVDEPKDNTTGSLVATPCAKEIIQDTLRYLKVEPSVERTGLIGVPNIKGMSLAKAKQIMKASGFEAIVQPKEKAAEEDVIVKGQYPLAEAKMEKGSSVILYLNER